MRASSSSDLIRLCPFAVDGDPDEGGDFGRLPGEVQGVSCVRTGKRDRTR